MKTRQFTLALLSASVVAALAAAPALAQTAGTTTTASHESTRLSTEFTAFAGSDTNAQSLVNGLRNGSSVTLTETVAGTNGAPSTTTTTTFTPDTGKMGYGNVNIALSLAEASLTKAGITDPSAAELEAALNGGTLVLADGSTVDLKGVLALRAAGEGWGQIADGMGFKLGDVMRSPKAAGRAAAGAHANVSVAKVEFGKGHMDVHPDAASHGGRPDLANKPDFAGKPSMPERPQIPDHPTGGGRPGG
ncbi:MAG: hypothetical protein RSP_01020 [Rhodanobacter sp.]